MTKRLRYFLPALATLLALPLVVWDILLVPQRIGYDAGVPFWPFEVPFFLLALFDGPAGALAQPFFSLFHLWETPARDALILLMTPLVWFWIGDRFDNGSCDPAIVFLAS